jgi:hypothetical protein
MEIKNFVLGVAIFIVTLSVVVYGIHTFYERPEYNDYCDEFKTQEIIETQERCEEIGGMWNTYGIPQKINDNELTGYCDRDYACRQEYEKSLEVYRRNIFLITLPLAILIIILGMLVFNLDAVGAGLMTGGVGTLIYGIGGYWTYAENWMKFVSSFIGLIVLIWLAYYANKKWNKSNKKR